MSFSKDVKEELSKQISSARHCRVAELSAIISLCGHIRITAENRYILKVHTENITVARKCFTLIQKTFNINTEIIIKRNTNVRGSKIYNLIVMEHRVVLKILQATKLIDQHYEIKEDLSLASNLVIQNTCCKRAFIRGAFLATGSMSNPKKNYHFEIVASVKQKAIQLQEIINCFHVDSKIVMRKRNYIIYLKEGSQIVELLNVMEAHVALMKLENVRILKEMRNSINRQVNCEAANINKTVQAATKQIEDIIFIKNNMSFSSLSDGLEDVATLRVQHPEASLKELGEMLHPPLGKSGVNHRLRKLSGIADKLRKQKEEISYDKKTNSD